MKFEYNVAENNYKMTLYDTEISSVINALDFYSRIWIGQYDHILWELRWSKDCGELDKKEPILREKFLQARNILLPKFASHGFYASYGIFSPERDYRAGVAYDMQQEFRYRYAWKREPNGGMTVDFSKPMPCDDDPNPWPITECIEVRDESNTSNNGIAFTLVSIISEEQKHVLSEALAVSDAKERVDIREIFSHYTDNNEVLNIMSEITAILAEIPSAHY